MGNLIQYRDPIVSQEQAQTFVEWLRDTKKLAASTIKRYLNSCRAIAPEWFQGIKAPRESKPEIRPFSKAALKTPNSSYFKAVRARPSMT
jgi:hypothetical protein